MAIAKRNHDAQITFASASGAEPVSWASDVQLPLDELPDVPIARGRRSALPMTTVTVRGMWQGPRNVRKLYGIKRMKRRHPLRRRRLLDVYANDVYIGRFAVEQWPASRRARVPAGPIDGTEYHRRRRARKRRRR